MEDVINALIALGGYKMTSDDVFIVTRKIKWNVEYPLFKIESCWKQKQLDYFFFLQHQLKLPPSSTDIPCPFMYKNQNKPEEEKLHGCFELQDPC